MITETDIFIASTVAFWAGFWLRYLFERLEK